MDIQRTTGIESLTGFALIARLGIRLQIHAIYSLGENTGTRRLAYPPGTAKQISLSQLMIHDRIPQRRGDGQLSDDRIKTGWTVFSR